MSGVTESIIAFLISAAVMITVSYIKNAALRQSKAKKSVTAVIDGGAAGDLEQTVRALLRFRDACGLELNIVYIGSGDREEEQTAMLLGGRCGCVHVLPPEMIVDYFRDKQTS